MHPNLQPLLTGQLLILRPLLPADFEALLAVAADPLIWEQHPEHNRYLPEVFTLFLNNALVSQSAFTVTDRATGAVIGSSRYYDYDATTGNIAIGYTFLARKCWGTGYNKEMKLLMIDYAFTFACSVSFHVGKHNYRSQKAVLKAGATLWKETADSLEYRLSKEQWTTNTTYRTP